MLYLLLIGIGGAHHAFVCGSGTFIPSAFLAAIAALPIWLVLAVMFSGVVFCIPPQWRGSPPAWLTVGALCAVVFFGGFVVAQFSPVHVQAGGAQAPECRTL
jgi:hypothetical protein